MSSVQSLLKIAQLMQMLMVGIRTYTKFSDPFLTA